MEYTMFSLFWLNTYPAPYNWLPPLPTLARPASVVKRLRAHDRITDSKPMKSCTGDKDKENEKLDISKKATR